MINNYKVFFEFTLFKRVVRIDSCHNPVAFFMRKCKCSEYSDIYIFLIVEFVLGVVKNTLIITSHDVQGSKNRSIGGRNNFLFFKYRCVYFDKKKDFLASIFFIKLYIDNTKMTYFIFVK